MGQVVSGLSFTVPVTVKFGQPTTEMAAEPAVEPTAETTTEPAIKPANRGRTITKIIKTTRRTTTTEPFMYEDGSSSADESAVPSALDQSDRLSFDATRPQATPLMAELGMPAVVPPRHDFIDDRSSSDEQQNLAANADLDSDEFDSDELDSDDSDDSGEDRVPEYTDNPVELQKAVAISLVDTNDHTALREANLMTNNGELDEDDALQAAIAMSSLELDHEMYDKPSKPIALRVVFHSSDSDSSTD